MSWIGAIIFLASLFGVDCGLANPKNSVCYDYVGCFSNEYPWNCFHALELPEDPNEMRFEYRRYVSSSEFEKLDYRRTDEIKWDSGKGILLVTHGWHDSGTTGWIMTTIAHALKIENLEVLTLDWRHEAESLNYVKCANNARVIAAAGGRILKTAVDSGVHVTNIHIAGHSLGGQLMAFLAKAFQQKTGLTLGRFTPLDAAGPMFDSCPSEARVSHTDAGYVDFIHTDSGKLPALSMAEAVGDADFYVNDGRHQPGCPEVALDTNCDHQRAVKIWTSSFQSQCDACPCSSYSDLTDGKCTFCRRPNTVGYYSKPVAEKTIYYLATTDKPDYCIHQS